MVELPSSRYPVPRFAEITRIRGLIALSLLAVGLAAPASAQVTERGGVPSVLPATDESATATASGSFAPGVAGVGVVNSPAKPANFNATAGDTRVTLSWNNPGDATITGYELSYTGGEGTGNWVSIGGNRATTTHTVEGLTNDTTYTFQIRAVAGTAKGEASDQRSAIPELAVPDAPTNFQATAGDRSVSLSWVLPTNTSEIDSVQVRHRGRDPDWSAWVTLDPPRATEHTVTGLKNGQTYFFQVRAVNDADPANPGTAAQQTARPELVAPDAPTGLTAAAGDTEVDLSWTLPDNTSEIDDVQVRWKPTASLPFGDADAWTTLPGENATSHKATGLTNGTGYTFAVRATNSKGAGPAATIAATPQTTAVQVPDMPTSFVATAGDTEVSLSWVLPTNTALTNVQVRWKPTADLPFDVNDRNEDNLLPTTTSYTAKGLTNGTNYTFEVRATNSAGEGAAATTNATPTLPVPNEPTNLHAVAGNGQVILTWDLPKGTVTGIDVRHRKQEKEEQPWSAWTELPGTPTTDTVKSLDNGATYEFEVRARNSTGPGKAADAVATLKPAVPAAPTGLAAAAGDGQVTLTWDPQDATITKYQLRYDKGSGVPIGGSWADIAGSGAGTTTHDVPNLTNGTQYAFQIRAVNSDDNPGDASDHVTATPAMNNPPTVAIPIADFRAGIGKPVSIDLSPVFTDPDSDELTYTADSSDDGTATVTVTANQITVTGVDDGTATITVTADDRKGGTAQASFGVDVLDPLYPAAPTMTDMDLSVGVAELTVRWQWEDDTRGVCAVDKVEGVFQLWYKKQEVDWIENLNGPNDAVRGRFDLWHLKPGRDFRFDLATLREFTIKEGGKRGVFSRDINVALDPANYDVKLVAYSGDCTREAAFPADPWSDTAFASTSTAVLPTAGLVVSPASLRIQAGASEQVAVALAAAPSGPVTVNLASDDTDVTVSPAQLSFDANNYASPQTITVAMAENATDGAATVTLTASGGGYDGLTATVSVERDLVPTFGTETIDDQNYVVNRAITTVTLPEATGGDGNLTYRLTPALPTGLAFDATATKRTISGTPTTGQGATQYTYTATDADGDADSLTFNLTVTAPQADTLTFTFTDDGTTTTIRASGSLDLSGGTPLEDQTAGMGEDIYMGSQAIWAISPRDSDVNLPMSLYEFSNVSTTGLDSYDGVDEIEDLDGYSADFFIRFSTHFKTMRVDKGNLTGNIYNPDGKEVSFTGTVFGVLDDNNFHIEHTFGNQTIIFTATPPAPPAQPANLNAEGGDTQVKLSWDNPNDATITGYQVRYGQGTTVPATVTWGDIDDSGASTTSHTVTGLTNGTQYAFEIRAVNNGGNSEASDPATATPEANTTPSFGTQTIADQTYEVDTAIGTLTLPAATGGNGTLTYTLSPAAPAGLTFDATARTLAGTPTTDQQATTYTYTATDTDGDVASLAFTITIWAATSRPAKPTNFQATAGDTRVMLTWDDPGDADIEGYQVKYQEVGLDLWEDIEGSGAATRSHTVENLDNGKDYKFQIRAYWIVGKDTIPGFASDQVEATPQLAVPDAPGNLTPTAGDTEVTLNWDLPTNASEIDNVQVRWKATADLPFDDATDPWNDLAGTDKTYTAMGLTNGTGYTFEVRASNNAGAGDAASAAATPKATPTPSLVVTPTSLKIKRGSRGTFTVALATEPTARVTVTLVSNNSQISPDFSTLSFGMDNYATAQTVTVKVPENPDNGDATISLTATGGGYDGLTASVSVSLDEDPPSAPTNLRAFPGDTEVTLTWDPAGDPNITGYQVSYQYGSDPWEDIEGSNASTKSHTVEGLVNGTEYTFQIRALAGAVPGDPSDAVKATPVATATPRLVVSPTSLTIRRAASGTFTVALATEPAGPVGVLLASDDSDVGVDPAELAFTKDNYATAQKVTVKMAENPEDGAATITLTGRGSSEYRGLTASVAVSRALEPAPAAPTIIQAVGTDQTVTLLWKPPTNTTLIDNFQVRYKVDGATENGAWETLDATATSYTATGLVNGTAYLFEVRAVNEGGAGEAAARKVTPNPEPLSPPGNVQATAGDEQVTLTWTLPNVGVADGFEVRNRKQGEENGWSDWIALRVVRTYTWVGLTNGTTYEFEVRATNSDGKSDAVRVAATPKLAIPDAPGNFTAVPGDGKVDLSWDLPTNASQIDKMQVSHRVSGAPDYEPWEDLAKDATTHTFSGLTNGTEYNFIVRALNGAGRGAVAMADAMPVATPPVVPAAPTGVKTVSGDTEVVVLWTLPTNTQIDRVELRYQEEGAQWNDWTDLGATAERYRATGLKNGTTYVFEVRAANAAGTGRSVSVKGTPELAKPSAPTDLQASGGDGKVELTWALPTKGGAVASIDVRHKKKTETNWSGWTVLAAHITKHTEEGLDNGVTYEFQVRATNAAGSSDLVGAEAQPKASTPARELTFTFTDDGSKVTVEASGSLDVSGFNFVEVTVPQTYRWIRINEQSGWVFNPGELPSPIAVNHYNALPDFTVTGFSSYTGKREIENLTNYSHDFSFDLDSYLKILRIDQANITGDVYDLTGKTVTFSGTLLNTVGDNDFHIELAFGNQKIIYTATPPRAPAAPRDLAAAPGDTEVRLTWTDPNDANITKYQVRYGPGTTVPATATWGDIEGSGVSTTSHTVTGLDNGTQYAFEIRAVSAVGNSGPSNTATATPKATPSLVVSPTSLSIKAGATGLFTVALATQPSGRVTVLVQVANEDSDVELDHRLLYFTAANYPTPQTVTVTMDGDPADGDATINLTGSAQSGDYAGVTASVSVSLDLVPSFGNATINDQSYNVGTSIAPLKLPEASGGDGTLTYSLSPNLPGGLTFDAGRRDITGTPTAVMGSTTYTYTAKDNNDDTAALQFNITVAVAGPPAAPKDLKATPGDTRMTLVWTDPRDNSISKYQVRHVKGTSVPDGTLWSDIDPSDARTTSHTVTGLTNDTTYTFEIRAVNTLGEGPASAVTETPKLAIPDAPTDFTAVPGDGEVRLSWVLPTNASEIDRVQVSHKVSSEPGDYKPWVELAKDRTTYTFTGLTNGTEYDFIVRALNGAGRGAVAEEKATPMAVPSAPTSLAAAAGDAQVVLTWTLPTGAGVLTKVQVRHQAADAKEWGDWVDLAADATADTVTDLTNGQLYKFEVRAANASGPGAAASVSATPLALPGAPTNLRVELGDTDTELMVTWTLPTNTHKIDKVQLRYKEKAADDTGWRDWRDLADTADRFRVTGLTNGTTYVFEVRAVNNTGTGPSASEEGTPGLQLPSAPTNLEARAGDKRVTLTWTLPSKGVVESIDVRHKKETEDWSGVTWTVLRRDVTEHIVRGLENGVTYDFQVRATNSAGSSGERSVKQQPKAGLTPAMPTGLSATAGNTTVTLDWVDPSDANITKYQLRYGAAAAGGTVPPTATWGDIADSGPTTNIHTVTGLTNGTEYAFQIRAVSNTDESDPSATVTATPDNSPPVVADSIDDVRVRAGGESITIDLAPVFTDPDGDNLTYTAMANQSGGSLNVAVYVAGDRLTLEPRGGAGTTTITVTANDGNDNEVSDVFYATAVRQIRPPPATNLNLTVGIAQLAVAWSWQDDTGGVCGLQTTARGEESWFQIEYKKETLSDWKDLEAAIQAANDADRGAFRLDSEKYDLDDLRSFVIREGGDSGQDNSQLGVALDPVEYDVRLKAYSAPCDIVPVNWHLPWSLAVQETSAKVLLPKPAAPTGLAATAGHARVTLTWTDPQNTTISKYQVRYGAGSTVPASATWADILGSGATTTTHPVTGLDNGTQYAFEIRAVNAGGESDPSLTVTATPVEDTDAPRVASIERHDPMSSPTNADSVTWRVTFSEAVQNVTAADFVVAGAGTPTVTVAAGGTDGTTWDVTAKDGDLAALDGTVTLSFASAQDIEDLAGNALTDTAPTGTNDNTYVLDNTAPELNGISRYGTDEEKRSPTKADSVEWFVAFSERVQSTEAGIPTAYEFSFEPAITEEPTWTVRRWDNRQDSCGSHAYVVTLSGGALADYNGTAKITLKSEAVITDCANNALTNRVPSDINQNTYELDNTAPTVEITGVSGTVNGPVTATFTFSETVTGFEDGDITLVNATATPPAQSTDVNVYTATITPRSEGQFSVGVAADVAEDGVGNGNVAATTVTATYDTHSSVPRSADFTLTVARPHTKIPANQTPEYSKFPFTPAANGALFREVQILTLPDQGNLKTVPDDRGSRATERTVAAGDKIPVRNVQSGAVTRVLAFFPPESDGSFNTTFTFKVIDARGVTSAGTYTATLEFNGETEDRHPRFNVSSVDPQTFKVGETVDADSEFLWSNSGNGKLKYVFDKALPAGLTYDGDGPDDTGVGLGRANAPRFEDTPTRVTAAETYTLTVSDTDDNTDAEDEDQVTFTIEVVASDQALAAPTGLAAKDGANPGDVDLSWDAIAIASSWQVRYAPGTSVPDNTAWADVLNSDATTTGHTVTGLTGGETYTFEVRAVNGGGEGPASDVTFMLASIRVSPESLRIHAGGSETFDVVLAKAPTAGETVTVTLTSDDTDVTVAPSSLTFTAADYSTAKTVTVSMAATPTDGDATVSLSASGGGFDGATASVSVSLNPQPSFGTQTIANQTYTQHSQITPLTLPEATGGDSPLTYTLTPAVPMGMTFDGQARTLEGRPSAPQAATTYTYTAEDRDGDRATLTFDITIKVQPPARALTFTFSDDGETVTIEASGTLDVSGFQHDLDYRTHGLDGLRMAADKGNRWQFAPPAVDITEVRDFLDLPDFSPNVVKGYEGKDSITAPQLSNYAKDFLFFLNITPGMPKSNWLMIDRASLSNDGKIYAPTGSVTFSGTLLEVLEDSDFHIELRTGNQDIVFKTASPATVPGAPTNLTALAGDTQVQLSWVDPSDSNISGYQVRFAPGTTVPADSVWRDISGSNANTTTHTVNGLTNGTEYAFEIRAVNVRGNGTASAVTATPEADTQAPTVDSITRQDPASSPTNADSLTWRVTFSEAVQNVTDADFAVAGAGTATLAVTAVGTEGTTYDVKAKDGDLATLDGTVTLSFASDQDIEDAAGNALTDTTPTGTNDDTYVVDNTAPTLTIAGVSGTVTAAVVATFTFSEPVTGFVVDDIALTNANASEFAQSDPGGGAIYTAKITPEMAGEFTVGLAADVAQDAAGNGNTAETDTATFALPGTTPTSADFGVTVEKPHTKLVASRGSDNVFPFTAAVTGERNSALFYGVKVLSLPDDGGLKTVPHGGNSTATVRDVRVNQVVPVTEIQTARSRKVLAYFPPDTAVTTSFTFKVIDRIGTGTDRAESAETYTVTLTFMGDEDDIKPSFNISTVFKQTFTVGVTEDREFLWSNTGNGKLKYAFDKALPAGLAYDGDGPDDTGVDLGQASAPRITGTPVQVTTDSVQYTLTVSDTDDQTGAKDEDARTFYIEVVPSMAALPQPMNFAAVAGAKADEVDLSWDAIAIASNWQVQYKQGDGTYGAWTEISGSNAATNSHTVAGLTSGATYTFRVRAVNGGGPGPASDEASVTLGNAPPTVARPIADQSVLVGSDLTVALETAGSEVFADADNDDLTYTATSDATGAATVAVSGATVTVRGVATGRATITVTADDGEGGTASDEFVVSVTSDTAPDNRAPVVANAIGSQTVVAGSDVTVALETVGSEVFADADDDPLEYTASSSARETATVSVSGATVTVRGVAAGTATVTVTASDKRGGTVSTTFTVTVTSVPNRLPTVARPIADQSVLVGSDLTVALETAGSEVFADADNDDLTYTATSDATGAATVAVSGATVTVRGVATGRATITVTADDGEGGTASDEFVVSVTSDTAPDNRAPVVANAIGSQTVVAGSDVTVALETVGSEVFADADDDPLEYTASSSARETATVSVSGATVTVRGVAAGTATVTVTASDKRGGTVSTTFTVTVTSVPNRLPTVARPIADQSVLVGSDLTVALETAGSEVFADADNDDLTYTATSDATGAATVAVSGATVTVRGVATGRATITVTADDGEGGTASDEFVVSVTSDTAPDNRAPVVANAIGSQTVVAGSDVTVALETVGSEVFADADDDPLEYTASSSARETATVSVSGATVTVRGVAAGTATVTVTASDKRGGTVSTTFTVTVTPVPNRLPTVARPIADQSVLVGSDLTVALETAGSEVFADADNDDLTYTATSDATGAATVAVSGATVTVRGVATGRATITVTADDGEGGTASDEFVVSVTSDTAPDNRAPVVANAIGSQTVVAGSDVTVALETVGSEVFADADDDPLEYTASSSARETATVSVSGATVTVRGVAAGTATVTVTASDKRGGTVSTTFTVTVTAVPNRLPTVARPIADQSVLVGSDLTVALETAGSEVFADADNDDLTYTATSDATGAATVAVSGATVTVRGVATGRATITVTADDGEGGTASDEFVVSVTSDTAPGNSAPTVANAIGSQTVVAGSDVTVALETVGSEVFADADDDPLEYTASSSAGDTATVSVSGATVTVRGVAAGTATVTVTASDKRGGTVSTTFTVTVTAVPNRLPTVARPIADQSVAVGSDLTVALETAGSEVFADADNDDLTYTATSDATGAATVAVSGATVTVRGVATGRATITVTADDGEGGTASDEFVVSVTSDTAPGNSAPTVANAIGSQTVVAGSDVTVALETVGSEVFADADDDPLEYTASSSAGDTATVSVSGATVTVRGVAAGTATITVTASDKRGGTVSTTFTVTVTAVPNRLPTVARPIADQSVAVGSDLTVALETAGSEVFADADNDDLTYTATSDATGAATVAVSGATVTVRGVATGRATITVTANDGEGGTASDEFVVSVTSDTAPGNSAPTVANAIGSQTVVAGSDVTVALETVGSEVFADADDDPLEYTASSSAGETATVSVSGATVTVRGVAAGTATVTVTASDKRGGTVSTTFTVTVTSVPNRLPTVARPIADQSVLVGSDLTVALETAGSEVFADADGHDLTYTATSNATSTATVSVSDATVTVRGVTAGTADIAVTASDGNGGMVADTFTVTVTSVANNPPTVANAISNQTVAVGSDVSVALETAGSEVFADADGDDLGYTATSNAPSRATVSVSDATVTVRGVAAGRGDDHGDRQRQRGRHGVYNLPGCGNAGGRTELRHNDHSQPELHARH